jgi:hypothetical protein
MFSFGNSYNVHMYVHYVRTMWCSRVQWCRHCSCTSWSVEPSTSWTLLSELYNTREMLHVVTCFLWVNLHEQQLSVIESMILLFEHIFRVECTIFCYLREFVRNFDNIMAWLYVLAFFFDFCFNSNMLINGKNKLFRDKSFILYRIL